MLRAGGATFDVLSLMPPSIEDRAPREPTDPAGRLKNALLTAIRYDAHLFRAYAEMTSLLTLRAR